MKPKFTFVAALFVTGISYSQNVFPTGAGSNVGIGTTIPSTRLQVTSASSGTSGLRLTNLTSGTSTAPSNKKTLSVDALGNVILTTSNIETSLFAINNTTTASSYTDYLTKAQVFGAGYPTAFAGYGVPTIRYGFNIYDLYQGGSYRANDGIHVNLVDRGGQEKIYFQTERKKAGDAGVSVIGMRDGDGNELFKLSDELPNNFFLHMPKATSRVVIGNWGNYLTQHKFVVDNGSSYFSGNLLANSNIGIGTDSFTDGLDTYRLSVDGAIRAHRVKVYTTWADYVFERDYELPTLKEVELYIAENGHLKDIPSAKTVEANGIDLGEMNKLLLQKIEELTLYVIELNKQMELLKNKVKN